MALVIRIHSATASTAGRDRNATGQHPRLAPDDIKWIRGHLRDAARIEKWREGTWTVKVVGDAEMRFLHQKYSGIDTTTDVLTFDFRPATENAPPGVLELDTAVCIDEAWRQSCRRRIPLRCELLLYAVHSLLHVGGHDDRTAADARRMHRREDELLTELRIGPVYQSSRNARCRR